MLTFKNKIKLMNNGLSQKDYENLIDDFHTFCEGVEDGFYKDISFKKLSPIPNEIDLNSLDGDNWLIRNWGTRKTAFNTCWYNQNELSFDTVFGPATPIFKILSEKFPQIKMILKFTSDKCGYRAGRVFAKEGKLIMAVKSKDFSKFAFNVSFDLMPLKKYDYTLNINTDNYIYDQSAIRNKLENDGFYKDFDGSILIMNDDKNHPLFDSIDDLPF